ncbi:uncharacterized protein LOC124350114 [Daphnia pulicaria]|uniref:uncharacterized protein LOC124350114 n=1 Tax=Daphnia pulicaria TaxID=35523 RepID=UPI001EEC51DD|nr:uncharacterized protein LOC124350114 [Daphnia pulicaria]
MEDSIHSCQRSASDQFDIDIENAFAKISIIPNYPLLKEMSHQPNMPTRYETVGMLDGEVKSIENRANRQIENYFRLRNLSHWKWNDEILPDVLRCVYTTTNKDFATFLPVETNIWVSGYFLPCGLFVVCREIRLATDSDIKALAFYGIP